MKKFLFLLTLGLGVSFLNAQTGLHAKIKLLLLRQYPELSADNKLIAINVWQNDDAESRETAKAFEKVYSVYQSARLKGGLKGIIVIGISRDNLSPDAVITLRKDGVTTTLAMKAEDAKETEGIKNIVFDVYGNEVYKDLPSGAVFSSVQKLITR